MIPQKFQTYADKIVNNRGRIIVGKDDVTPEDVVREAIPVLAHRVTAAADSKKDAENHLQKKISDVVVPLEDTASI